MFWLWNPEDHQRLTDRSLVWGKIISGLSPHYYLQINVILIHMQINYEDAFESQLMSVCVLRHPAAKFSAKANAVCVRLKPHCQESSDVFPPSSCRRSVCLCVCVDTDSLALSSREDVSGLMNPETCTVVAQRKNK